MFGEPLEILSAMGHGRSYGKVTSVLGRKLSGIFFCGIWDALRAGPALPTVALVTDIGNDLLYGASLDELFAWLEAVVERLDAVGAHTVITSLPLESVQRLGSAKFRLLRSLLFPSSRASWAETLALAQRAQARLARLAEERKTPLIPVENAWYGWDTIHLRRRVFSTAWGVILAHWLAASTPHTAPWISRRHAFYLRSLRPAERWIWGMHQTCAQPCAQLKDGTTISLF
jgi:hypothetical protein